MARAWAPRGADAREDAEDRRPGVAAPAEDASTTAATSMTIPFLKRTASARSPNRSIE